MPARIVDTLGKAVALGLALFHLYTAAFGTLVAIEQRSIHLALAVALVFLTHPASRRGRAVTAVVDLACAALGAVAFLFVAINHEAILLRMTFITPITPTELILGAAAIVLVLEAARRTLGLTMMLLPVVAILYALFGDLWLGPLSHRGFSLPQVIEYQYLGTEGIFGIPVGIAATYLVLLVLFGTMLERSGVGDFIMRFALALAGRSKGGPAQVAVVASALFGSVSGSAVANVYASGTSSIPLMKRCGYTPAFAGSVEAVASTGGQLVPPVLGAAAFVMADIIGVPYLTIVGAAAIPAILYFLSVGTMIHFEAARTGMQPLKREELPRLREVVREIYMLVPLVGICVALFEGYSVSRSALIGIVLAWLVSLPRAKTRMGPRAVASALMDGARRAVVISIATACASLIVGVFTLTGLGLSLTSMVALVFQNNLFLALTCTALASLVLGMGVPTVVAYLLVASLVTPMLTKLGVSVLSAHMFAFYFGILSMITPPVAMAAWAGAQLAQSNFFRTALVSTKLGAVAFVVPYFFVYRPELLGIGSSSDIALSLASGCVGVVSLAAGLQGWLLVRCNPVERIALIVAGLSLIWSGGLSDLAGLAVLASVVAVNWRRRGIATVKAGAA
ncbi:TRAP transporter permease [Amorphus sp. 3PC139-8]|uniref:TRAP transporter permease n=1 Tax=Amorphus sp. 3PC139-8 TaxID=2735676 RepID=UPI00345DB254